MKEFEEFNKLYTSVFFSWAFLCVKLGYESNKAATLLLYDLAHYLILIKDRNLINEPAELCACLRALSLIQTHIPQQLQRKVNLKVENYFFIHLGKMSTHQVVEVIKYGSKLQVGGSVMMWKIINNKVAELIDQFSPKAIQILNQVL